MKSRKLVDRDNELNQLEKLYLKKDFRFIIITGRRRIGKSRLVLEFIKNKDHIRVQFEKRNQLYNLMRINQEIGKKDNIPNPSFASFSDAFKYLSNKKNMIIVLDEFSYLIKYSDALAEFQTIVDELLKNSNIMLITLGSSFSIMNRGLLEYSSPLYGRSDGLINLQPLKFKHLFLWFPKLNIENIIRIHSSCGGVPRYLEVFNEKNEIMTELESLFFDPNSFLFREARELLEEEFDDPVTYYSVLEAVSMGATRVSDIGVHAFLEPKNTAKYLNILIKMGILKREVPYAMGRKRGIYRFKDHYFSFWFRFVSRYFEDIESGFNKEAIYRFRAEFDQYLGQYFENAMAEIIPDLLPFELISMGRWWNRGIEIDLIAEGRSDTCFVEFKWSKLTKNKAYKIIDGLITRSESFSKRKKNVHYLLFAREIANKLELKDKYKDENIHLLDLDDLKPLLKED